MTISKTQTEALLEASSHIPWPWPSFLTRTPERTAAVLEREGLAVMKYDGPGPVIICATTAGRQMAGWLALFFLSAVRNAPKSEPKSEPEPLPSHVRSGIDILHQQTELQIAAKMKEGRIFVTVSIGWRWRGLTTFKLSHCLRTSTDVAQYIVKQYHAERLRLELSAIDDHKIGTLDD